MENDRELKKGVIEEIVKYISERRESDDIKQLFSNKILKGDVLSLLDHYCTVIYYPLPEDERNNGFHITGIPDNQGNERHFVFINTSQTMEKQVFTAAHELGHIWNVDDIIEERCHLKLNASEREKIINRFAAELVMPEDEFKKKYSIIYYKYKNEDGLISLNNLLQLIASLMNTFLAPLKSVVYRLEEIGALKVDAVELLLGEGEYKEEYGKVIESGIQRIIDENGYLELKKGSGKKWINGLSILLDRADKCDSIDKNKIEVLRDRFELTAHLEETELKKEVSISFKEVLDENGNG